MPKRFLPRILSLLLPTVLIAGCTLFPTTETNTTTETTGDDNTDVTTEENTNAVGDEGTNDNVNTVLDELDESTNTVTVGETPATDIDTSDWLTYENEEYGFSLRYPSSYSFDESREGVNFRNIVSDPNVAGQENIKFYVQNYSEAPEKEGEAYALLSTKSELTLLKNEINESADKIINGIPVNIYHSYDVPGEAFYKGANFFANQDYIMVSMVIMPTNIEYPNHPFDGETRKWSDSIVEQLNEGQLISQGDQIRIQIFDAMINTLQVL